MEISAGHILVASGGGSIVPLGATDCTRAAPIMHSALREWPPSPVAGVRLWTARLETVSDVDFQTLSASLNATEQARAARFHFAADRRNFVTTRALLRDLLGTILRTTPGGLEFKYGAHGKPRLASDVPGERIHFNLSHGAGWALFAVGTDRELGVDLESASRLDQDDETLSRLAARILSARELGVWKTLTSMAARRAAFLRAWTRKEAYLKATGRGFSDRFQSVEMILDAHAPNESLSIESRPRCGSSSWLVHDLAAPEGFAAALAVEQSAVESSALNSNPPNHNA